MNKDHDTRSVLLRKKVMSKQYLTELQLLTGKPAKVEDLVDLQRTMQISAQAKKIFNNQVATVSETPVASIRSEHFRNFIAKLKQANPSPVYVWTPRSLDCGTFVVSTIDSIQFEFDSSINPEGIMSLLTVNFDDLLLLDLNRDTDNGDILTIEAKGKNWSSILF